MSLWIALLALQAAPPEFGAPSFEPRFLRAPAGPVERIVTLAPSATELIFALGEGRRVVGVSRFDDAPLAVLGLPKVGGFIDPSVEAIVGLRPDLVVAAPNAANRPALERLAALGIGVLVVPGNAIPDVFSATRALAPLIGAELRAERFLADFARGLTEMAARAKDRPRRRAIFVYEQRPLVIAGPGSLGDAALELLGLENIARGREAYPKYSLEQLLIDRPEVIIDASFGHGGDPVAYWRRLGKLPAVREGRVYPSADAALLRPGPRLLAALAALAARLDQRPSANSK